MDDMTHLDGNALAGVLADILGQEMTVTIGCCGECGAVNAVGALFVYRAGLGDVLRCPVCSAVLLVVSTQDDAPRLYLESMRWLGSPSSI